MGEKRRFPLTACMHSTVCGSAHTVFLSFSFHYFRVASSFLVWLIHHSSFVNMNFFAFVIAAVSVTLRILSSSSSVVTSSNSSSIVSSSAHDINILQHRLTMVESDIYFQIQSSERPNLCMEVFKTLDQVGCLWLQQCKSKDESGIERQMFGVTIDGKLHPSTRPSSCIFLYKNKSLRYRKNCAGIIHKEKNHFMYDFFYQTFFLMGGVTNVMILY